MKKLTILLLSAIMLLLVGCGDVVTTVGSDAITEESEKVSLTYTADFYDNNGGRWLSVEGKSFSISPNKVKTYSWDSDGHWISSYEMSSVMSIDIDGNSIESCGSTIIFADTRLEKQDIGFNNEISTSESSQADIDSSISAPRDLRIEDYWKIKYWWIVKNVNNKNKDARLVIVQSQLGNPICVYSGNEVTWDIPKNLPKTTEVMIDGMALYIHRANFAIVDTSLLEME